MPAPTSRPVPLCRGDAESFGIADDVLVAQHGIGSDEARTQREERHERDPPRQTFVKDGRRSATDDAQLVLPAYHRRAFQSAQQVLVGDVA